MIPDPGLDGPTAGKRSVIIVTYGRSGSTLLMSLLNRLPATLVRGENSNLPWHLYEAWRCLDAPHLPPDLRPGNAETTHPWFGIDAVDRVEFLANCRRLLFDMLVPAPQRAATACFGFKEIRYFDLGEQLPGYLDFLRAIMPRLRILFLLRGHEAVSRSGWWGQQPRDFTLGHLTRTEAMFRDYRAVQPESCFTLTYEDMVRQGDQLRQMFAFLGEAYDAAMVSQVLAIRHSF